MTHLLCVGMGYSATWTARELAASGWRVTGTSRTAAGAARIVQSGFEGILFSGEQPSDQLATVLASATHIVVSVPPDENGEDRLLQLHQAGLAAARHLTWIGYLSTIGVYGDRAGDWVNERDPPAPGSGRSQRRLAAEESWLDAHWRFGLPAHIFRLAGIYGPGRSAIDNIRAGTARRIVKPGQVFNRIHVADVCRVLRASIDRPNPGALYNVADDEPAPPQDVIAHAAGLLGLPPPPAIAFADAELSPMARSFYAENKRVANSRIKAELGVTLSYPSYREGLQAIFKTQSGGST